MSGVISQWAVAVTQHTLWIASELPVMPPTHLIPLSESK